MLQILLLILNFVHLKTTCRFYFMSYLSLSLGNLNNDTDELYLLLLQCPAAHIFPPQCFLLYGFLGLVSAMSVIWNIVNQLSFHNAKKNWQGLPQGKTYYGGIYKLKNPGHPSPQIVPPTSRGSLSRLLSNAIVRLLQKDWGEHYSRPSMASQIPSKLQSHMQCSLEG